MLFQNVCSNFLTMKEPFDEVAVGYRFALFEVIITYMSLGIVKDSSDCFWRSNYVNIEKIKIRLTR